VLNEKIVTIPDIYKFNISKTSPFLCFNCDKPVHFRQSRNADNNYTEHFYHPNNVKETHIECERNTLERVRDNDTWHNKLSGLIEQENREVIRKNDAVKHIVDAYDSLNDMGIEFQNSPISVEAIQSRAAYMAAALVPCATAFTMFWMCRSSLKPQQAALVQFTH